MISVVLETEDVFKNKYEYALNIFETIFLIIFTLEYFLRIIVAGRIKKYSGFMGRIKFIFSPMSIIDLLAIIPSLMTAFSSDFLLLRIVRLLRMLRLLKLIQNNPSLKLFSQALIASKLQLYACFAITLLILFASSIFIYLLEGNIQPEAFGSIPRSMWWAITTLTTVGYGDVYPITILGKVFAGIVGICGIGIIAMPAGIISANFKSHKK